MNLQKILQDLGLRDVEAKVYLATLELGEATAAAIAKKTRIKRPSVYVLLKSMIRQGYISSYTRSKVTRFAALDPKKLVNLASERVAKAEAALPDFNALSKDESQTKPRIQFYEGINGLITVMEDTIVKGDTTIYAWADIELAWKTLGDYYPEYIRKKNERNVFVKAIFVENKTAHRFKSLSKEEGRNARLIPADKYPMSNEIIIYDDKVAILSHIDQVGVIIQNQEIMKTQLGIFKLGWDMAEQIDKQK